MELGRFSIGIGDRFGHQGKAQLKALLQAANTLGLQFTPVWNKSNREHTLVGTQPADTRAEADSAVRALGYSGQYFVDADHINLNSVDKYIDSSDFFTIDVADYIGMPASEEEVRKFVDFNSKYIGKLQIPGIAQPFDVDRSLLEKIAGKFLFAAVQASEIYKHILKGKGAGNFVTEVSMDEVNDAQTPVEMFFILSALALHRVPLQTIAPKFTGRFNKGVDYVGCVRTFEQEFEQDLLVIDFAVKEFGLPANLKLSIHSGSDKFSIYPVMGRLVKKYNKGLHLKTAGTTWLEEAIGLALAGGSALALVKKIYATALGRMEELCAPYATVIDIDKSKLPSAEIVDSWSGDKFANTLRHIENCPDYNANFRQLIHVSFKVAAEFGSEYYNELDKNELIVAEQVIENIYSRHLLLMFE